jgi:hypothetical protein
LVCLLDTIEDPESEDYLPTPYYDLPEFIRLAKERLDDDVLGMPEDVRERYELAIDAAITLLHGG